VCVGTANPVGGLDELIGFQILVEAEEVFDRVEFERGNVADIGDVIPPRVPGGHAQHVVVAAKCPYTHA
jgi:hypothetical protein